MKERISARKPWEMEPRKEASNLIKKSNSTQGANVQKVTKAKKQNLNVDNNMFCTHCIIKIET